MTLQELLNSDMRSLAGLARQGLAWWLDELAAILPPAVRARFSARPRLLAEPLGPAAAKAPGEAETRWRFWRDGRLAADETLEGAPRSEVGLLLGPGSVLTREVPFPRLPLADVRRMVALDLDRLSPLRGDLVFVDVEVLNRDAAEGRQSVLVGVVPRALAIGRLEAARAAGLDPKAISAALADGSGEARFDFLPAVRAFLGEREAGGAARYWWAAVAAFMALNLGLLVGRDIYGVDKLRDAVAAQQPAVNQVMALRRKVEDEAAQRRDLVARAARSEPLRMLAALTAAVPADAWVQRLEWNGQTLRIVGYKTGDADLFAALKGAGAFANPRAAAAEAPAKPGTGAPFDITVDAARRVKPGAPP